MKLIASMIVRNEMGRYLEPCLEHLLEFCDEIRIIDDGSTDGTYEYIRDGDHTYDAGLVQLLQNSRPEFMQHEGAARQELLEWTLEGDPTHVLAIDADEFISDGPALRAWVEQHEAPTYTLCMTEVWNANELAIFVRCDGGWCPSESPLLYAVPPGAANDRRWKINPKAGGCGREPIIVRQLHHKRQSSFTDIDILHLGWTNKAQRKARHARYADAGSFGHNPRHIQSIMFADTMVALEPRPWPDGLLEHKPRILDRIRETTLSGGPAQAAATDDPEQPERKDQT